MSTTGDALGTALMQAMLPAEQQTAAQLAAWKKFGNAFVAYLKVGNPDENGNMVANADGWPKKGEGGSFDLPAAIHAAISKETPAADDEIPLADSGASYGLKKFLWSNILVALASSFGAKHPVSSFIQSPETRFETFLY